MFLAGLLAAGYWDARHRRVPNALNFGFAATGALAHAATSGLDGLIFSVGAWLIALAIVFVPFVMKLYRGGDAKLVMAIAAWLGPRGGIAAFVYGMVAGGLVALVVAMMNRKAMTQKAAERPDAAHAPMAIGFGLGALAALAWPLEGQ